MRLIVGAVVLTWLVAASALAQVRPAGSQWLELRAQFESVPVRVAGRNANEIYRECMDLVASSGLERVRELYLDGQRVVRRNGAFGIDAACALGALNAVPSASDRGEPTLTGAIDGIPIVIHAPSEEAREIVRRFVPIAAGDLRITRLTIAGEVYLSPDGWSSDDVVSWLDRALGGDGVRQRFTVLR